MIFEIIICFTKFNYDFKENQMFYQATTRKSSLLNQVYTSLLFLQNFTPFSLYLQLIKINILNQTVPLPEWFVHSKHVWYLFDVFTCFCKSCCSLKSSWLGVVKSTWPDTLPKLKVGHPEQFEMGPGPWIDDPTTKIH